MIACLLMISGWCIVAAAILLLASLGQRYAFVGSGFAVELLGLGLLTNHYREMEKER